MDTSRFSHISLIFCLTIMQYLGLECNDWKCSCRESVIKTVTCFLSEAGVRKRNMKRNKDILSVLTQAESFNTLCTKWKKQSWFLSTWTALLSCRSSYIYNAQYVLKPLIQSHSFMNMGLELFQYYFTASLKYQMKMRENKNN